MAEFRLKKKILEYRPIDYRNLTTEDVERLGDIAYTGVPLSQIGKSYGLTSQQMAHIHREFPDKYQHIARSAAIVATEISQALVIQARGGNINAIKWYEQSRLGYTDKAPEAVLIQKEIDGYLEYLRQVLSEETYAELADATAKFNEER